MSSKTLIKILDESKTTGIPSLEALKARSQYQAKILEYYQVSYLSPLSNPKVELKVKYIIIVKTWGYLILHTQLVIMYIFGKHIQLLLNFLSLKMVSAVGEYNLIPLSEALQYSYYQMTKFGLLSDILWSCKATITPTETHCLCCQPVLLLWLCLVQTLEHIWPYSVF